MSVDGSSEAGLLRLQQRRSVTSDAVGPNGALILNRPATDPPARHRASDAATHRTLPLRLVPPPEGNLVMKVTSQAFRPCYIFPGLVARPVVVAQATAGRVVESAPTHYTSIDQLIHDLPGVFRSGLIAQLKATLDLYVKRIMPTEAESKGKRDLFNSFADFCFLGYGQRISMSVVGSTAYEADTYGSDLDIVLLTNTGQPLWMLQNIEHTRQQLIGMQPSPLPWLLRESHVQVVDSARVPLLSMTTPSGILCDISVNTLNSIRHTTYFKSVIEHNLSLRPVMRMLKYWAKARRLPTMREGGLPGIVWMILVVFYGTCPLEHFLSLSLDVGCEDLLAACDREAPVFGALYRFFRLCGRRRALTRTITISKAQCIEKDDGEVAERVASLPNHHGVWDEVVSVEDPSSIPDSSFNLSVRWVNRHEALASSSTSASQFEPGGPTDLAAKISAATWLVYILELKRGSRILSKLMRFMRETTARVESLASAELNPLLPPISSTTTTTTATATAPSQSAQEFIAQQFRQHLAFLFEESYSSRFVIPGCADRLRQLEEQLARQEQRQRSTGPSNKIDQRWESSAVSARGLEYQVFRPFCGCCSRPKSDLAVVLLNQRLHVLKITSICPDWSTWWTREFLSRRDVRSILHGTLHQIVRPEEYLHVVRPTPSSVAATCNDNESGGAAIHNNSRRDTHPTITTSNLFREPKRNVSYAARSSNNCRQTTRHTLDPDIDVSVSHSSIDCLPPPPPHHHYPIRPELIATRGGRPPSIIDGKLSTAEEDDEEDLYGDGEHNADEWWSQFYIDHLPPTGWPAPWPSNTTRRNKVSDWEQAGRTAMPSLLLPVRSRDNCSPIDVLFSPCNFVCRLKGWLVDDPLGGGGGPEGLLASEVYFLESDELAYLEALQETLQEAPWYDRSFDEPFQPAVLKCHPCNVEGEDLETLADTADYAADAGVFQRTLPERTEDVIRLAWQRWLIHLERSERTHKQTGSESDTSESVVVPPAQPPSSPPPPPSEASSSSKSTIPPRIDHVLAGEFTKATALLSHAIERLHREAVTSSPAAAAATAASPIAVRRACSFPDSRTLMRSKRDEQELYIPPSKRALVEPVAATAVEEKQTDTQPPPEPVTSSKQKRRARVEAAAAKRKPVVASSRPVNRSGRNRKPRNEPEEQRPPEQQQQQQQQHHHRASIVTSSRLFSTALRGTLRNHHQYNSANSAPDLGRPPNGE